jgi:tRNA A-37 threonylcarbamoyl transferase component Bud32
MKQSTDLNPAPQKLEAISPPLELLEATSNEWISLDKSLPVISYLTNNSLGTSTSSGDWEGARFSRSVYLFKDSSSEIKLIVKFFQPKTGTKAVRHAEGEKEKIDRIRSAGLDSGNLRAIKALDTWCGVLFLEYIDGLTLGDVIAVHRSQPGTLLPSLCGVAELLAKVHRIQIDPQGSPDATKPINETLKYTAELSRYGVLKDEPVITDAILKQIGKWRSKPAMNQFTPALCHGDATTTNFIFTNQGHVVAIDWERLKVSDPATDMGRLLAEVNHSLREHGENGAEIATVEDTLFLSYSNALDSNLKQDSIYERVRFYQASSTLRIARNGWISRMDRLALVTRALAMLS